MSAYDDAVTELSQVPLGEYIAERKRLAGELKAAGDKTAARVLGTRPRPPISAWAVNQLYWHARDAFDELLETAERLRKGDLKASAAHREALAKLRKRAATILEDAGHNANEATLRRVTATLSAIAATGDWGEDKPGTIVADRDPPGFEAVGIPAEKVAEAIAEAKPHDGHHKAHDGHAKAHDGHAKAHGKHDGEDKAAKKAAEKEAEREAAERRAAEMAEKKAAEEERKRRAAETHRLETALRTAKVDLHEREHAVKTLEKELEAATGKVTKAQELVDELAAQLAELREDAHN